jgi:hypothetical protein
MKRVERVERAERVERVEERGGEGEKERRGEERQSEK